MVVQPLQGDQQYANSTGLSIILREVYPYALLVRFKLDEVNRNLEAISQ